MNKRPPPDRETPPAEERPAEAPPNDLIEDTAAKLRQIELTKEIGHQFGFKGAKASRWTWAKFPNSLIYAQLDLPPKEEAKRANWKPIPGRAHDRVMAVYLWHPWCWPICMPYAVVTDAGRHEILRDQVTRHFILLSQDAVAELLGMSQPRVATITQDLLAQKRLRIEIPQGRRSGYAVFPEPKPFLTDEERGSYNSTVIKPGVEGPRLEPAVMRSFSNLLNKLGSGDATVLVPPARFDAEGAGSRKRCWWRTTVLLYGKNCSIPVPRFLSALKQAS